ncbi:lipopolysaccharide biosynthesis protein, partial [Streptomyces griseus]|uniref:lipopolysaccharide biosynthesis protein n=1 Tax=Streptomyces griseus TaxID=1911 RepID=UPI000AA82A2B
MTDSPEQQRHITVRRLRTALARLPHWWPLPVCVLIGTASGLSYGALAADRYEATSYAMAVAEGETDPSAALGYAQSYGRLTTSDATLSYAQGAAGEPVRELRSHVRSGVIAWVNLISFTPVSSATWPLLTMTASMTALAMSAALRRSSDVPVTAIIGESGEVSDRTWDR